MSNKDTKDGVKTFKLSKHELKMYDNMGWITWVDNKPYLNGIPIITKGK